MKDARGHGSNSHQQGVEQIGKPDPQAFAAGLKQQLGLRALEMGIHPATGHLRVDMIGLDKKDQRQGTGTRAMEAITSYADQHGLPMSLTTAVHDPHWGTTSSARLKRFYKQFGFVENKGRNYDPVISDNMIRHVKRK